MTNKQAFEILLTHRGYRKALDQPSRKLDKWVSTNDGSVKWLGKSGALRVGKTLGESSSITHLYDMNKVKAWALTKKTEKGD